MTLIILISASYYVYFWRVYAGNAWNWNFWRAVITKEISITIAREIVDMICHCVYSLHTQFTLCFVYCWTDEKKKYFEESFIYLSISYELKIERNSFPIFSLNQLETKNLKEKVRWRWSVWLRKLLWAF